MSRLMAFKSIEIKNMESIVNLRRKGYSELEIWKKVLQDRDIQDEWQRFENIDLKLLQKMVNNVEKMFRGSYKQRLKAIETLGSLENEKVLPFLLDILQESDYQILCVAINALKKIKSSQAIEPLMEKFKNSAENIRSEILSTLADIDYNRVKHFIINALQDPYENVRYLAAMILGESKEKEAIQPLINVLTEKEDSIFSEIVRALGQIDQSIIIQPLIEELKKCNKKNFNKTRFWAIINVLGQTLDKKAIEVLNEELQFPYDQDTHFIIEKALNKN